MLLVGIEGEKLYGEEWMKEGYDGINKKRKEDNGIEEKMIERFGEYGKNDLRKRGKKVKELI